MAYGKDKVTIDESRQAASDLVSNRRLVEAVPRRCPASLQTVHDPGLVSLQSVSTAPTDPSLMGYASVLARHDLFSRIGVGSSDLNAVELNEAFASQAVAGIRDAGLDPELVNPLGGAIALGYPVGATGAI